MLWIPGTKVSYAYVPLHVFNIVKTQRKAYCELHRGAMFGSKLHIKIDAYMLVDKKLPTH